MSIGEPTEHALPFAAYQQRIAELAARAERIDLRDFELSSAERLATELQPAVLLLAAEARSLLLVLLQTCEATTASNSVSVGVGHSYLPFERAIDATMQAKLGQVHAIEEIAFVAQLELRQRTERLERLVPQQGSVPLLIECDSSLRRIQKGLAAVDTAIAGALGVPPVLDFTSELQSSLAVRRAYGKFRSSVAAAGEPTLETLRPRLRLVGTQIAVLVGLDVYRDLRIRDRLLLRGLQERVLGWLRGTGDATPAAGVRLWHDLAACIEMLGLVNRRQELVEHDQNLLRDLRERLASSRGEDVDAETLSDLIALKGHSPRLDDLLKRPRVDRELLSATLDLLAGQERPGSARAPIVDGDTPAGESLPW